MKESLLPVPEALWDQAKDAAAEENVSTEHFLVSMLSEGLSHCFAWKALVKRASRADVAAALRILEAAPDVPPEKNDEW